MKNFKAIALLAALFAVNSASLMGAARPLSSNASQLLEATRNKQLGVTFIERGVVTEEWLMKALAYIINGRLTRENKQYATDQIMLVIDALYGDSVRNNRNITDEQKNQLISRLENKVTNFMDKLYVGGMYTR